MATTYGFDWGFSELQQELYPLNDMATMYQMVAPLQPKYWRMMAAWNLISKAQAPGTTVAGTPPTTTNRDWSTIDRCINDILLTVGADIIMIIGQARPTWSAGGGGVFGFLFSFLSLFGGATGPTATDFGNFCKEVAQRYQPGGVGIRTDGIYAPNAGKGVTKFEIWNEQNNAALWVAPISPNDYVAYLKAGYAGIKSVLPGSQSTVIFGGLMHSEYIGDYFGYGFDILDEYNFLSRCYQIEPALGSYYDAMATHFYTESDTVAAPPATTGTVVGPAPVTNTDNFRQVQAIHTLMTAKGDGAKKIWITECGFGCQSLTQAQQSTYMQQAFANLGTLSYIAAVIIFNIRDLSTDYSNWNNTFGMMTYGFVKKPIWSWLQGLTPHGGNLTLGLSFAGTGYTQTGGSLTLGLSFTGTGKQAQTGALSLGLTFSGTAAEKITAAGTLSLGLSFAGTGAQNTGTGSLSLGLTFGATAQAHDTASGSLSLGLTFGAVAGPVQPGAGALALALSFTGTGEQGSFGTLSLPLSFSGPGSQYAGSGALSLSSLSFSGTGADVATGAGALSLALSFSGTGIQNTGSGALSLSLSFSGTGTAITGPQFRTASSGGSAAFGNSATASTTDSISVTAGDTIYAVVTVKSGGNWITTPTTNTITDSTGDTFTLLQSVAFGGVSGQTTWWIHLFKCVTTHGGAHNLTSNYTTAGGTWVAGPLTLESVAYSNAGTHANITTQGANSTANAALNISQTSAAGHRALVVWSVNDTAYYSTFNQTGRANKQSGSTPTNYVMIGDAAGASTVSFTTTTADSLCGAIALDMSP